MPACRYDSVALGTNWRRFITRSPSRRERAAWVVGREGGQAVTVAFRPAVVHDHVLPLDISHVGEAAQEGRRKGHEWARRSAMEISNGGQRALRVRRERPRRRAAVFFFKQKTAYEMPK